MEMYKRKYDNWETNVTLSYEVIRSILLREKYYIWENIPQVDGEIISGHAHFSVAHIFDIVLGMDLTLNIYLIMESFKFYCNKKTNGKKFPQEKEIPMVVTIAPSFISLHQYGIMILIPVQVAIKIKRVFGF